MIEIELSKDLKKIANKLQKKLKDIDFESTRNLSDKRDYYGYIGQMSVIKAMEAWGLSPDYEPYISGLKGDEYDFKWRGETFDVKSSPLGEGFETVFPRTRFLVMDEDREKKIDRYVFVKVGNDKIIIAGEIAYDRFWGSSSPMKARWPCHYVEARNLGDFLEYAQKS